MKIGGHHFRRCEVLALRQTERGPSLPQRGIYVLVKPGFVPELKRRAHPPRQARQKLAQPPHITLEIPRQLKQHRSKFLRPPQRFERSQKLRRNRRRVAQALAVRDPPVCLDGKSKMVWRRRSPALEQFITHPAAEGIIHFHRIQPASIMIKKSRHAELRRIKIRLPAPVSPPRSPRIDLSHRHAF